MYGKIPNITKTAKKPDLIAAYNALFETSAFRAESETLEDAASAAAAAAAASAPIQEVKKEVKKVSNISHHGSARSTVSKLRAGSGTKGLGQ